MTKKLLSLVWEKITFFVKVHTCSCVTYITCVTYKVLCLFDPFINPTSINPNTHQPQHPPTPTSINPKINQFQHPSTLTSINPNIHQPPNSPFYFLTWHSVCMLFFSHLWKVWNYIIKIFSTEEIYTPYLFLILFLTPSHTLNNLIQSLT